MVNRMNGLAPERFVPSEIGIKCYTSFVVSSADRETPAFLNLNNFHRNETQTIVSKLGKIFHRLAWFNNAFHDQFIISIAIVRGRRIHDA